MKLGLALSGGGFRASFFHLGVLARMAEWGLLRHVEALSTVSGGSILGAVYYVHLKRLLETKADADIRDEDYVHLVEQMEGSFLAAVQKNIRMRNFLNPWKNIKMSRADYSRSDRIGELYDELLYRPAFRPGRQTMIEMRELKILPLGDRQDFHPRAHNAGRRAKVPILLLNATALNTGHNWRFEASTMGTPPRDSATALDVDKNRRLLRPPSYADVTPRQQNVELGLAVAASACVPGVFHPLALSELYESLRIELVDGGVHDNQGIQGLLDEDCTHLVVSDASGQMEDAAQPATRMWAVLSRTSDVLMDRVREEELLDLLGARGLPTAFVHLRRGLPVEVVPYFDQHGKPAPAANAPTSAGFGVDPRVQECLSRIRTDLDSFTEIEACSLMLDGYLMSEPALRSTSDLGRAATSGIAPGGHWRFLAIQRWMSQPTDGYLKHLRVGHETLFKLFRLSPLTAVATAAVALVLAWLLWRWQGPAIVSAWNTRLTVGQLVILAAVAALGFVPGLGEAIRWLRLLRSPTQWLLQFVLRGLLPALGAGFVWLHLQIFDRLFLGLGRLDRLK